MGEIKLLHHVFTSISGYKTVYASPDIDRKTLDVLEDFSETIYPRVRQKPLRSLFHPSGTQLCISRAFRSSADHAGRQRSCVHNILVSRAELLDAPFVNPFEFSESLFLRTAPEPASVRVLGKRLPGMLDTGEPTAADLNVQTDAFANPLQQAIFSAVTSSHDMAVIAPSLDCYAYLGACSDMLPPHLRLSTAVISGTYFKSAATEGATLYELGTGYDTRKLKNQGLVVFDSESGATTNLPAPNRYFSFIYEHIDGDPGLVGRLVALVNAHPLPRNATNDMYHNLVRAFEASSACVGLDGSLDPLADIDAAMKSLVYYYQAGYKPVVMEMLGVVFADLEGKGTISGSGDILAQLDASLEDYDIQSAQKEAAITRIAGWLSRSYSTDKS